MKLYKIKKFIYKKKTKNKINNNEIKKNLKQEINFFNKS